MSDEFVAIRLPLSVWVATRLMTAIDAAWPGIMATADHPLAGDHLVFRVPADADDGPIDVPPATGRRDPDVLLTEMRDGTFGFSLPEYLAKLVGTLGVALLDDLNAANYVELRVEDDTGPLTVTVQRYDGKSPHELRVAAEAERDMLRQVVRKMNRLLPGPRGREVMFSTDEHQALMAAIGDDPTDHKISNAPEENDGS